MSHAMTDSGDYRAHSDYQAAGALTSESLVTNAAAALADPSPRELQIVDYGCAQGRVSNQLVKAAIEAIRQSFRTLPIVVCHNDVLENDWATLFDSIRSPNGYMSVPGGRTRPMTSAGSFYEPVVAPRSVDLGISFAALQWLDRPGPTDAGTALYFDQLPESSAAAMQNQADADWVRFLTLREAELAEGGRLVLNMMSVPDGGSPAGHQVWGKARSICEELVDEGAIQAERLEAYVFPVWERTEEEILKPFADGEIGLHIEHVLSGPVPNPIAAEYAKTGDASAYAASLNGFFRAFSEPSLASGLSLDDQAANELYSRLEQWIATEADRVTFQVHATTLTLSGSA